MTASKNGRRSQPVTQRDGASDGPRALPPYLKSAAAPYLRRDRLTCRWIDIR